MGYVQAAVCVPRALRGAQNPHRFERLGQRRSQCCNDIGQDHSRSRARCEREHDSCCGMCEGDRSRMLRAQAQRQAAGCQDRYYIRRVRCYLRADAGGRRAPRASGRGEGRHRSDAYPEPARAQCIRGASARIAGAFRQSIPALSDADGRAYGSRRHYSIWNAENGHTTQLLRDDWPRLGIVTGPGP